MYRCYRYAVYSIPRNGRADVRWPILGLVVALVVAVVSAGAQELDKLVPGGSNIAEVRLIRADSMSLTQREGEPQVLRGNVEVVIVERDKREARIRATKISIFTVGDPREFDRVVAEGHVVMEREGMLAKTELAIYDGRQSTVDLLEDNYVADARGELTADRIRINLVTNEVVAEGNVRGVVYPQELKSADNAD